MKTTRKRRWWQFGLRWLFVAMLVVAAYFAGRVHRDREMRDHVGRAESVATAQDKVARELEYQLMEARTEINTLRIIQRTKPVQLNGHPQE